MAPSLLPRPQTAFAGCPRTHGPPTACWRRCARAAAPQQRRRPPRPLGTLARPTRCSTPCPYPKSPLRSRRMDSLGTAHLQVATGSTGPLTLLCIGSPRYAPRARQRPRFLALHGRMCVTKGRRRCLLSNPILARQRRQARRLGRRTSPTSRTRRRSPRLLFRHHRHLSPVFRRAQQGVLRASSLIRQGMERICWPQGTCPLCQT
ncbi:hypothetical protein FA95DRAFT_415985 [Auriscalpium vulgare]|uniref:Uncharacterized protein n=1 Tax=Auriscalpium vulgare TaxID=40419 RepID=A0ACB8S4A6_9AGAM|nr:hypothetical protein FA95DRAFT_415985 [Auriscalpium vulgare]